MDPLDKFASDFTERWNGLTLEDLRQAALKEASGIAFEAARIEGGPRTIIVMCITDKDQVAGLIRLLRVPVGETGNDWKTFSLGSLLKRAMGHRGLGFDVLKDAEKSATALVLIAPDPDSARTLEGMFNMPK